MYEWQNFDAVFQSKPDHAYDHKHVETISRHRKELGGTLFFDRVWSMLGLKQASKSYPPKSNNDLRNLWQKIVKAPTAPDYQKHALLYYVLRDCRQLPNEAINFARRVWLPEKYQRLVSGLWELDNCQFSRALEHLTDPSLTPTFTDEILYTLIQHPKCDNGLAMAYYITLSPPLRDSKTLDAYFSLLCRNSVVEAYHFCQKQDQMRHKSLFEQLIITVHSEAASEARADRALTLIGLPLSDEEEAWFEECLLHGKGSQLHQAKDSVLMRRIAMGEDYEGPGPLDRYKGQKVNGVNWDDVRNSMQKTKAT